MRKEVRGIVSALLLALVVNGAGSKAKAGEDVKRRAVIYVDASESMRPLTEKTKEFLRKLTQELKAKDIDVSLESFGKRVRRLESVDGYKATESDTNYAGLLEDLKKRKGSLVFVVTDGKVPARHLDDLRRIREIGSYLNDEGTLVCSFTPTKPSRLLKSISTYASSFDGFEEALRRCLRSWKSLWALGRKKGNGKKEVTGGERQAIVTVVDEKGFKDLGRKTEEARRAESIGGLEQVEVIIKARSSK